MFGKLSCRFKVGNGGHRQRDRQEKHGTKTSVSHEVRKAD